MTLGNRLKTLRHSTDLTQADLLEELKKRGVEVNRITLSRWENDKQEPTLAPVIALASIFNVSAEYIANGSINSIPSTPPQQIPDEHMNRTFVAMNNMNQNGKKQVADYAELLDDSDKYKAENKSDVTSYSFISEYGSPLMLMEDSTPTYTIGSAAAGEGFEYGDYVTEYKLFMTTDIPDHDFSLSVKGDSMFPTIIDGETIFVIKDYDKIDNDIYVLDIDGETTVKRVAFGDCEITLISDNEEFDERVITGFELEQTRILGRVVGWEMPTK